MTPMRIFGWAADEAGCRHYRLILPLRELAHHGHAGTISVRMPKDTPDTVDIIVGQRVSKPAPSGLWQKLAARPRHQRPALVYEIDDDLFEIDPVSNPAAHAYYAPAIQANIRNNIAAADHVTVSTDHLASIVSQWNPAVTVLPNCVPGWLFDHKPPARDDGVVTLGWQGSGTHDMDWDGPGRQVERFLRQRAADVELHMMGGIPATAPRPTLHIRTRLTNWVEDIEKYYAAVDWHIALAPLRPHLFNRAKSSIRVVEAQALGIPVVASAAGPYEAAIQHYETGLLVRYDHEWMSYLRLLVAAPDIRARIGRAGREYAQAHHNIETQYHRWENLYRELL